MSKKIEVIAHSNAIRSGGFGGTSDPGFSISALQDAIFSSVSFSCIATDTTGLIHIFNVGAARMCGYTAVEVVNVLNVTDLHDPDDESARAEALSAEFACEILPGFESLIYKASRGMQDVYEVTTIRKDGSRFPALVSVTSLGNPEGEIIGYLLIGTDNTARKGVEEEKARLLAQQDKTDQALKDAHATLQVSEANLAATLNSIADGVVATDANGRIIRMNPVAEVLTGWTFSDARGASVDEVFHIIGKASRERVVLPVAEVLSEGTARGLSNHTVLIARDGKERDIADSCAPIRDRDGIVTGTVLVFRDVTGEYLTQQALRDGAAALLKASALQNAIFNSANFSSIATDARGVIQIFNVGAENMLGYAAIDVVNKITPAEISDPAEIIARAKALSSELGTPIAPGFDALVFKASRGIEDIYELTYLRKDGTRLPAVVSVTALRDAASMIIGYLLIGTDNTARKRVEADQKRLDQRLRDQQFYTRSLIESNIDALMTTDPEGTITDVNKQMESLTGCTRDELIGAVLKDFFTEPDRAQTGIDRVLREKKVTDYELTARARDGEETDVSFNATTFYDRERTLQGVFASARDITVAKRLDLALKQKNIELENASAIADQANLAKSEFLSSMSHELRSPLNAILGFTQLLESEQPPPSTGQRESLDQILKAGWHLLKLINEILDLATVESGRVPLSEEPVAIAEVLLECREMMEEQARRRGIAFTISGCDVPLFVRADRTRLKQIVINLFSNAVKYSAPTGRVRVVCSIAASDRIRVTVSDDGAGLTPVQVDQLFQAFNRLGREGGAQEGTGIGLVVARKLVELMGGCIGVVSTVGVGSDFWFELQAAEPPAVRVDETANHAPIMPIAAPGNLVRRMLYVEDNPANMLLVQRILLRRPDIALLTATTGTLGVESARAHRPEVILMDINLPGISGFDALKALRADPKTAHIPVMALSANAMPRDITRGMEAGFFRYLTKPIDVTEFLAALDQAFKVADQQPTQPDIGAAK